MVPVEGGRFSFTDFIRHFWLYCWELGTLPSGKALDRFTPPVCRPFFFFFPLSDRLGGWLQTFLVLGHPWCPHIGTPAKPNGLAGFFYFLSNAPWTRHPRIRLRFPSFKTPPALCGDLLIMRVNIYGFCWGVVFPDAPPAASSHRFSFSGFFFFSGMAPEPLGLTLFHIPVFRFRLPGLFYPAMTCTPSSARKRLLRARKIFRLPPLPERATPPFN